MAADSISNILRRYRTTNPAKEVALYPLRGCSVGSTYQNQREPPKPYGLPDDKEGVAVPSIVVVDRKGTVPNLYSDRDFANGPGDEEIFEALEGMTKADQSESDASGAVENWTSADNAVESTVRPDRSPMTLDVVTPTIGAYSVPPSPSKGGSALSLRVPPSGRLTVISRWARSTRARPMNETK